MNKNTKKGVKKSRKRVILLVIFLLVAGIVVNVSKSDILRNNIKNKKQAEKLNLDKVKANYGSYMRTIKKVNIYNKSKKKIGKLLERSELIMDDNYTITDEYYKLSGEEYYVKYNDVSKIDNLTIGTKGEYKTYKNYIPYNSNVITNDNYKLYIEDQEFYESLNSSSYPIIITMDDKYGIEFNNRLVYINKNDVKEIIDNNNTNSETTDEVAVLNYHYTVNKEAGELNECTQYICMTDKQVEEEIKYLSDNGFYATTLRDIELFVSGNIRLPQKSVTITIDDGWYVSRMITILEKYKLMGTLFLIGSLASPNDYKSDYLEIHSHSWNMHTPGVCSSGNLGGAILCWNESKILEDLKQSRESLNNTTYYCYPFYEHDSRSIKLLKKAGFTMAFTGGDKKVHVGDNLYLLNRYQLVNYTDINTFISYVN